MRLFPILLTAVILNSCASNQTRVPQQVGEVGRSRPENSSGTNTSNHFNKRQDMYAKMTYEVRTVNKRTGKIVKTTSYTDTNFCEFGTILLYNYQTPSSSSCMKYILDNDMDTSSRLGLVFEVNPLAGSNFKTSVVAVSGGKGYEVVPRLEDINSSASFYNKIKIGKTLNFQTTKKNFILFVLDSIELSSNAYFEKNIPANESKSLNYDDLSKSYSSWYQENQQYITTQKNKLSEQYSIIFSKDLSDESAFLNKVMTLGN